MHHFTCSASLPYLCEGKINKQTKRNPNICQLLSSATCHSNRIKEFLSASFWAVGSFSKFQAKGWGQCSAGVQGFRIWGWCCAGGWDTQEWVGKGHRDAQTRAGVGSRHSQGSSTCSESQVPPGLFLSNPAAAAWVLPIPQGTSLPCLQEKHSQAVYETSYGDELTFKTLHSLHFHL